MPTGTPAASTRALALVFAALFLLPLALHGADAGSTAAQLPSPRYGTSAVWDGAHGYVFGGFTKSCIDARGCRLAEILRFDTQTNAFATMAASLPSGRYSASAVWTGTEVYLFGGQGDGKILDEIVRYDPQSDTVTVMNAKLPAGIVFASAVWDGTHAYVFGGLGETYGAPPGPRFAIRDQIVRYAPATDTVEVLSVTLPSPRTSTSAVWDGESAYVFGGFGGLDSLDEIVRFTPATGEVSVLASRLPAAREATSAVWTGSEAYVLGGRRLENSQQTNFDEVLRFSPETGTISLRTATLPSARYRTSALWDGGETYVFGGYGSGILDDVVRIGLDPPSAPRELRAVPGAGVTALAWLPPATEGDARVESYRIYRGTSGLAEAFLAEVPGSTHSFADGTCRALSDCTYGVVAVNAHGASRPSNLATALGTQPCLEHNPQAATNACLEVETATYARPDAHVVPPALEPGAGPCLVGPVCGPVAGGDVVIESRDDWRLSGLSGDAEATALCGAAPSRCRTTLP